VNTRTPQRPSLAPAPHDVHYTQPPGARGAVPLRGSTALVLIQDLDHALDLPAAHGAGAAGRLHALRAALAHAHVAAGHAANVLHRAQAHHALLLGVDVALQLQQPLRRSTMKLSGVRAAGSGQHASVQWCRVEAPRGVLRVSARWAAVNMGSLAASEQGAHCCAAGAERMGGCIAAPYLKGRTLGLTPRKKTTGKVLYLDLI
jgi:hypothetical protein